MAYHWELEDWPNFRYNQADILPGGIQLNARSALQLEE